MGCALDLDLTIKAVAVLVSSFVLIKGICEYKKAQQWKKLEFVSKEMKDFFNDFNTKRALILLDWNSNTLQTLKNEVENKEEFYFDDDIILKALKTHKEINAFTDEEVVIKKLFDDLFDKISTFESYIQTGLINTEDVLPYLNYYINILANPKNERKSKEVRDKIWAYVAEYEYVNVRNFCHRKEFRNKNGY